MHHFISAADIAAERKRAADAEAKIVRDWDEYTTELAHQLDHVQK